MAITRPTGEQLRFRSANTGDHVLDTYLESAEIGGRALNDLLDDLFDPANNGTFRTNNFEFRFDAATDKIQFRIGQFASGTAGWQDLTTFFNITGAYSSSTTYNNFDVVTVANNDVYIVHGLTSGTTFSTESAFTSSSNTEKLVDVSGAQDWAVKTNGIVQSTDYSSKAYAIGGTGVDNGSGSAKDWAIKTSGTVGNTSEYSAKYWATSANVVTVATGIANINTVATAIANVNTVATDIANVNTTATNIANVNTVAPKLGAGQDVTVVATAITNVNAVATDIANVNTTAGSIGNVNIAAGGISNINTVAGSISNVNTVAGINAAVTGVNNISSAVTAVNNNATNINAVNANSTNINTVAGISSNVTTVAGSISNVNTVANIASGTQTFAITVVGGVFYVDGVSKPTLNLIRGFTYTFDQSDSSNSGHPLAFKNGSTAYTTGVTVNGTAGNAGATVVFAVPNNAPASGLRYYCTVHGNNMGNTIATSNNDIATVSAIAADITSVANIDTNVTTVAGIQANVTTVAGIHANVTTVAGVAPNVTTVAGISGNVTTVANNNANVTTVATNIADVNSFANTYFIGSSAPTGAAIGAGDLWYDNGTNNLKVYNGSAWVIFISNYNTDNLNEGSSNLYYTDGRVETYLDGGSSTPVFASGTVSGAWNVNSLTGPATLVIDPAAVGDNTGTVRIAGSLQVDGTTTTVNSTNLSVADLNITVADGAANAAAADGAGLTVDGASATLTYNATSDAWVFNKNVKVNTATLATTDEATALAIALG